MAEVGKVFLVGAGPGDAGLLSEKAKRCLAEADIVVYDRLVSPQVLNASRPDAHMEYVGKEAHHHPVPQSEINQRLVDYAKEYKCVVRLKGGDPFVFGRGGEEALCLAEAGIPFEIVPGVTSAIGALSYAGIPVTHRQVATSFTVVTGHECVQGDQALVDWSRAARYHNTLVILMGIGHLSDIVDRLVASGNAPETAVAVVQWGTIARQKSVVGCLQNIVQLVDEHGIESPGVIVVGEVVRLSGQLAWSGQRPLHGSRWLIGAYLKEDAEKAAQEASVLGCEVVSVAMQDWAVAHPTAMEQLVRSIHDDHPVWYFGDPLDVHLAFSHLRTLRIDFRRLSGVRIHAADAAVVTALRSLGIEADSVATRTLPTSAVRLDASYTINGLRTRLKHVLGAWEGLEFEMRGQDERVRTHLIQQSEGLHSLPRWADSSLLAGRDV